MNPIEQTLSVFTVDDSEIVYKIIGPLLLETKNITWLGHAFSLGDAYLQVAEKKPEVVILDIQLGVESGFEFLEYLSKNHPNIPVIMFSNLSSIPYRQKCKQLGAKYFLDKSSEFEKLPEILSELMNNLLPLKYSRSSI
ncbi:MAG: response regulator [Bacteroidota bacterium]